jgi:5-formaminoimidazole-4-carboxamide-1-beta-D-ribofuranosyl 5'-monophosphate synthetase
LLVLKNLKMGENILFRGCSLPINREDMQEVAKTYHEPIALVVGSNSGLEVSKALRHYGLRTIVYVTRKVASDYTKKLTHIKERDQRKSANRDLILVDDIKKIKKRGDWKTVVLQLDAYPEIVKYVDELIELECIQIPSKAFSVLVGGDEKCSFINNQFAIPIMGSRNLFKLERIDAVEKDYRWFAQKAGIPFIQTHEFEVSETGIRLMQFIDEPVALMTEYSDANLKRVFVIGENSRDLEERVSRAVSAGNIDKATLERSRVQQFPFGLDANLNFFFSPIDAKKEWGDVDDALAKLYNLSLEDARACLANELVSLDERRVDIFKKLKALPIDFQAGIKSFHLPKVSLNFLEEFLLEDLLKHINSLFLLIKEKEPPGMIGSWSLQATLLRKGISSYELKLTGMTIGLYDGFEEETIHPLVNFAKLRRGMEMTLSDRTALELYRAKEENALPEIVT